MPVAAESHISNVIAEAESHPSRYIEVVKVADEAKTCDLSRGHICPTMLSMLVVF